MLTLFWAGEMLYAKHPDAYTERGELERETA
jgi:hypothetical protein